jgi:hypothetical protein
MKSHPGPNNILPVLVLVLLTAVHSHAHAQGMKERGKTITHAAASSAGERDRGLRGIIVSTTVALGTFADSLSSQLIANHDRLCRGVGTYADSLCAHQPDSLDLARRNTLRESCARLLGLIRADDHMLKRTSSALICVHLGRLEKKRAALAGSRKGELHEYEDMEESLRETADSVCWIVKDSCSAAYHAHLDNMNDTYYIVRDSLESVYSLLMENQSADNDRLADLRSELADSLSERRADSLRYFSSQYSFYNAISHGFDRNPLCYYARPADQVKQLFTQAKFERNYASSSLDVLYMGTLTVFNALQQRNYYEHTLSTQYRIAYHNANDASPEQWSESEELRRETSTDLTFALNLSARWDKDYYSDYNNTGADLITAYRHHSGASFLMYDLQNTLGYRSYTLINELSNATDVFQFSAAHATENGFHNGISVSAGMKYYTVTVYDTAIFAVTSGGTVTGNGKAGGTQHTQISLTPQSPGSYQLTVALFNSKRTASFFYEGRIQYCYDVHSEPRFLGKYLNTTFLSEDIYNESFAYHGPEGRITVAYDMPAGFSLSGTAEIKNKLMKLPAFNLRDEETAPSRKDLASAAECCISKYFEMGKGVTMDISAMVSVLRNQSNDEYNDYSSYTAGMSIGIGF